MEKIESEKTYHNWLTQNTLLWTFRFKFGKVITIDNTATGDVRTPRLCLGNKVENNVDNLFGKEGCECCEKYFR